MRYIALLCLAMLLVHVNCYAGGAESINKSYKRKITKSRAKALMDQGGKTKSGKLYVYKDDDDIEEELRNNKGKRKGPINIGTVSINGRDRIKEVNVVIDTKKDIKVDTGYGRDKKVNIGTVRVHEGAKVPKSANILIKARSIQIK